MTENPKEDLHVKNKVYQCPYCNERIVLETQVRVIGFRKCHEDAAQIPWIDTLPKEQRDMMNELDSLGVIEAYREAFVITGLSIPKNIPRAFFGFLRSARKRSLPKAVKDRLAEEYGQNISVLIANSVAMVVVDGIIRQFIPQDHLVGVVLDPINGGKKKNKGSKDRIRALPIKGELDNYIKTRFGLVDGKGAFFDAMRVKSIGEFNRNP